MKALLALAIFLPHPSAQKADVWQPYTSLQSRIHFEMPTSPIEENFPCQGGQIRSYSSEKNEIVYEAMALEMVPELKASIMEVVSDADTTVGRMMLDGFVESNLEELEAKPVKTDYERFQKLPCRITLAKLAGKRSVKFMSVLGKSHIYLFIVSYPQGAKSEGTVKRFLDSVRFES